ncbi:MAG: 50S ribosomal protein L25 [Phycisphaerales bacterium]|nr:50S ribosomal protein L25 [Phycisphaerales bacterium]
MEIPTLNVEPRKAAGSRAAARLRRSGKLPAVLYGHGREPASITLDYHDVEQHMQHGLHVVKLDMEGKVQPCQFKDAQYDYLGSTLVHIDLVRVDLTERVTVTVPLDFRGTPKGVSEGGIFHHELTELEIECVVAEIPESIRVDIFELALDQVLHVKDIQLPEGVTAMGDPESAVAVVRLPSTAPAVEETAEAEGEAASAEPEVIAKGKAEDESAGEEKS